MRKLLFSMVSLLLLAALAAPAAEIDGKWVAEMKIRAGKAGGEDRTFTMTLDLKTSGNQLTGTITTLGGRRERSETIQDGKIEGNKFSFYTIQKSRQGEIKIHWEGTVEGNKMTGIRTREGAPRGVPFTAKKQ